MQLGCRVRQVGAIGENVLTEKAVLIRSTTNG